MSRKPAVHAKSVPIGVSIGIISVVGLIAWTIIVAVSSKPFPSIGQEGDIVSAGAQSPAPVTSVLGKVLSIEDGIIIVRAAPQQNPQFYSKQDFVVRFADATKFILATVPQEIPSTTEIISPLFQSKVVSVDTLRVDDEVNVRLGSEVGNSREITADSIEITRFTD